MAQETSKANSLRRSKETNFVNKFFVGKGIDVGAGSNPLNYQKIGYKDSSFYSNYRFLKNNSYFPKIDSVKIYSSDWDSKNEAENILSREGIKKYDFCYSSNLLEHVINFQRSLLDFSLVTKANGYLICSVPDFLLYEKEIWPPTKNVDHISCFSVNRDINFETHYNLAKILTYHTNLQVIKLELADTLYDYSVEDNIDQTNTEPHGAECFIEFVCKVLPGYSSYNNYAIISPLDFLSLDDRDITQDVLVVQDTITETEKLRIANLPYSDTFIPLADSIQNTFPVFINKNHIAKFKNSLK